MHLDVPMLDAVDGSELAAYRRTLLGRFDDRVLTTTTARIGMGVLLGAVLIVGSFHFIRKIDQTQDSLPRAGGERHRTALGRWLPTAKLLTEDGGQNPYGYGHWFPTPPMVLLSLVPLTQLGYIGAGVVWAALMVAAFLFAMFVVIRSLGREGFSVPLGVLLATGVFSMRPIYSEITRGNVNLFMMFWLALAWGLYVRKHDFWAGILVALAVVTKITPALVIVYFLYKRAWRVCAGAGVGLVLVFGVIPSLLLGIDTNGDYLRTWFQMLVAPFAIEGYVTRAIENQSLIGVTMRLLSNAGVLSIQLMPADQLLTAGMEDDMMRPATTLGLLLKPTLVLPILGWLAWCCRTRCPDRRDVRHLLEFGMVLLAMLLLSERTWKHHATTLPIVFLGVWYALTCMDWSDRFRRWFVAGLVVQFLLLVASSQGILQDKAADMALDGGAFCWGLVLCLVQAGILIRATRPRMPSPEEPPMPSAAM